MDRLEKELKNAGYSKPLIDVIIKARSYGSYDGITGVKNYKIQEKGTIMASHFDL